MDEVARSRTPEPTSPRMDEVARSRTPEPKRPARRKSNRPKESCTVADDAVHAPGLSLLAAHQGYEGGRVLALVGNAEEAGSDSALVEEFLDTPAADEIGLA